MSINGINLNLENNNNLAELFLSNFLKFVQPELIKILEA